MKKLTCIFTLTLAFVFSPALYAQAKKKAEEANPAAEAPATKAEAKAAETKATKPGKALPFHTEVDEIDAAGKSFTHQNVDGKKVKNVVTATTEIKQGEAVANFEDIKVGDTVSGLRLKKAEDGTEYDIVKITKFGPKPAKGGKADGDKKTPGEPKKKADK